MNEHQLIRGTRVVVQLALVVSAATAGASLVPFDLLRSIADALAPDGDAATVDRSLHAALVAYARATAIAALVVAAPLLAGHPAIARRLPKRGAEYAPALVWPLVFAAVLAAVNLSYLDREVLDESTYVIMGSHVLDGHLPYLELFALKPPGIYLALAAVMSVFGESVLAVRFFGAVCLLVAAVSGYAIAVRRTTPLVAGASMAIFCALTAVPEFQGMPTQYLTLAAIMPACWLLVARRDRLWAAFLIGVLLSVATLTRTNIGFVALAVGLFFLWRWAAPRTDVPRPAMFVYALGGTLPLAPLLLAYWLADGLEILMLAVLGVPLHYASSQLGIPGALLQHVDNWLAFVREMPYIFLPATLFIGSGLAGPALCRARPSLRGSSGLLLVVLGAVSLSILNGQAFAGHLLQVLPLTMLLAGMGFATLLRQRAATTLLLGLYVALVGASLVRSGASAFGETAPARSSLAAIRDAAAAISADRCCGELVYAPHEHLVYWYLEQRPPSAIVHPSAINHAPIMTPLIAHGYVSEDEHARILRRAPGYIVLDPDKKESYLTPQQRRRIARTLQDRFRPWKRFGNLVVYKRTEPPASLTI